MTPLRPRVIANFAISADGKVTTRARVPTTFTSPADKARLREIRSLGDALLAGGRTVAADTMSMRVTVPALVAARTARGQSPEPLRVIASGSGRVDPDGKIFQGGGPVVVFSSPRASAAARSRLARVCDLWILGGDAIPVRQILGILRGEYRVRTLVCEGGPGLFAALAAEDLVDELYLTLIPRVFGGAGAPSLTGSPAGFLASRPGFRIRSLATSGDECFLHLTRTRCTSCKK